MADGALELRRCRCRYIGVLPVAVVLEAASAERVAAVERFRVGESREADGALEERS